MIHRIKCFSLCLKNLILIFCDKAICKSGFKPVFDLKKIFFKRGPVNSLFNLLQYYLFYILAFLVMRHPSSQIKDQTHTPCTGRWSLNHWTIREVPKVGFNNYHSQKEIWIQKEEVLWLCLLNRDIYFSNPFNYTIISL